MRSSMCDIPAVRLLTSTSISLRVSIASGGFVDAFYNEQTDTMAFAFIREGQRLSGRNRTTFRERDKESQPSHLVDCIH
jgi:hypothetical protein